MRRILVGYDGSTGARRALDAAIAEARERRSSITILAVEELPLDPQGPRNFGTMGDIASWEGRELEAPPDVVEHLAEARDALVAAGLGGELSWAVGEPAAAIVDAARSMRADVIILGEHHHGFLTRYFGADVGAEVQRVAGCAVELA
jgi:nucleotide-binding universal stress UspA family protein